MAEVQVKMSQLVTLAIGSPEAGAVNFNLIQKVLLELLKLTELDTATVWVNADEAAKLEETQHEHEENVEELKKTSKIEHQCPIDPEKIDQLLEDMNHLKFDLEDLSNKVITMSAATDTVPFQDMRASLSQIDGMQNKMNELEILLQKFKDIDVTSDDGKPLGERLTYLEKNTESHTEQLDKINGLLGDKLENIETQLEKFEKEMGEMNEKLVMASSNSHLLMKKSLADSRLSSAQDQMSSINNVISRLSSVQHELDNLTATVASLNEEQVHKQMEIDTLIEELEVIKMVKADKTNMEDILAAKADKSQVHRKVSHDHFETKIEQLNTSLEGAFHRLDNHEETWQEEVELLKQDIENKLDKLEFSPLKEYVNERLKFLQEKMKLIAAQQKRDAPASGIKKRIIKDVQCISCDNDSVMKMDNTLEDFMAPPALPSQQSVKPYLTYKLDQVRKQQTKLPTGKNLLHFEEMLHDSKNPKMFHSSSRSGEHLVNRYVGGSHTITNPQQRITRTGNYFETWGPIITKVNTSQPAS